MSFNTLYYLIEQDDEQGAEKKASPTTKSIESRIKAIEDKLNEHPVGKYNVIPSAGERGRLSIIDVEKGAIISTLAPRGKLISVPVVFEDIVSFAVQDDSGSVLGTVHKIPEGTLINQFRIGKPPPGAKYREVMGREDDPLEDEPLPVEPELEDDPDDIDDPDVATEPTDSQDPVQSTARYMYDDPDITGDVSREWEKKLAGIPAGEQPITPPPAGKFTSAGKIRN